MCTVTWSVDDGGYSLLFNRDEKLSRAVAEPPRIHTRDGVRFGAPTDADGGGTWIAANEYGVTVCLLNAYPATGIQPGAAAKSRGEIPVGVASSRSLEDVAERINRVELGCFAPFRLLALEPDRGACLFEWSGSRITLDEDVDRPAVLTSSSFESAAVAASRRVAYGNCVGNSGGITRTALERFHASHDPKPGPFSVCMHRTDARTVSLSRVSVSGGLVRFDYSPDAPCRAKPATTLRFGRIHSM